MSSKEYHQAYYLKNRDKIIAYAREYHKKNKSWINPYKNARAKEIRKQRKMIVKREEQ